MFTATSTTGVRRMSAADRTYLEKILGDRRLASYPKMSPAKYFEFFSGEQILKKYEVDDDEIKAGIVGKGGDGGIDSIYCFLDRHLVRDDTSLAPYKKPQIKIDLRIIQSKSGGGSFDADVMDKFLATTTDLLDTSKQLKKAGKHYNKKLVSVIRMFREHYLALATYSPRLTIWS